MLISGPIRAGAGGGAEGGEAADTEAAGTEAGDAPDAAWKASARRLRDAWRGRTPPSAALESFSLAFGCKLAALKEFLKNSAAQLADKPQLNDTVLVCSKCGKSRFCLGSLAPRRGGRFDCSYLPVHSLDHSCSTPQTRSQEELKAAAAAVWAERAAALLPLPVKGAASADDAAHAHAPPADAPLAAAPAGVPGAPGGGRKAPRKPAAWKPAQPLVSDLHNILAGRRARLSCLCANEH